MKRLYPLTLLGLAALFTLAPAMVRPSSLPSGLPQYTIVPIKETPNPRYKESSAQAINDQGEVLCDAGSDELFDIVSYLWKQGKVTKIGSFDPKTLNDQDMVLGIDMGQNFGLPIIWYKGHIDQILALGMQGLNNKGQAVGFIPGEQGAKHDQALLWESGHLKKLGALPGFHDCKAYAINDAGEIAGECIQVRKVHHHEVDIHYPCLYMDGKWHRIGNLSAYGFETGNEKTGSLDWKGVANASFALNNKGQVIIQWSGFNDAGLYNQTILWNSGLVQKIPGFWSVDAINDNGQVVGAGYVNNTDPTHALLWENGHTIDLNTFLPAHSGWLLKGAHGINNRGEIVDEGELNGHDCGFLMTPMTPPANKMASR